VCTEYHRIRQSGVLVSEVGFEPTNPRPDNLSRPSHSRCCNCDTVILKVVGGAVSTQCHAVTWENDGGE